MLNGRKRNSWLKVYQHHGNNCCTHSLLCLLQNQNRKRIVLTNIYLEERDKCTEGKPNSAVHSRLFGSLSSFATSKDRRRYMLPNRCSSFLAPAPKTKISCTAAEESLKESYLKPCTYISSATGSNCPMFTQ